MTQPDLTDFSDFLRTSMSSFIGIESVRPGTMEIFPVRRFFLASLNRAEFLPAALDEVAVSWAPDRTMEVGLLGSEAFVKGNYFGCSIERRGLLLDVLGSF